MRLALTVVNRVFACDNMAFSGDFDRNDGAIDQLLGSKNTQPNNPHG
jgi:hypothetical protein